MAANVTRHVKELCGKLVQTMTWSIDIVEDRFGITSYPSQKWTCIHYGDALMFRRLHGLFQLFVCLVCVCIRMHVYLHERLRDIGSVQSGRSGKVWRESFERSVIYGLE
eukprot:2133815-Prymnesium_polylepis.1